MKFTDKDGNVIDIQGIDDNVAEFVGLVIEGQIAAIREQVGEQIENAIGKVVSEQIQPITNEIKKLGDKKPETDPGKTGDDDNAVLTKLSELAETVNSMKQERESEKTAQTSRQLAEQYVNQHRPNLRGKDRLINRIAAAGVTNDDECKKELGEWEAEMKDLLGDEGFEKLSADPEREGAKDQPKGSEAEKDAKKKELLSSIRGDGPARKTA